MEKNQKDPKKDNKQTTNVKADQQKSTIMPKASANHMDEKSSTVKKDDKKQNTSSTK